MAADRSFCLRFWGTRGSLPAPRPTTNRFGGNTPCVEIRAENKILIFDAGSGIRPLGEKLLREAKGKRIQADIFFTHYHWDHIHGFPFFSPAYVAGNRFTIYGESSKGRSIKEILAGQMALPYFPVPIEAMQASFTFRELGPAQRRKIGPVRIRTEALNHPGKSLCYRIDYQGKSIVYATDTEHTDTIDQKLVQIAHGADILIYDASYTNEEYRNGRQGWGHSTWMEGIKVAHEAQVDRLLLFHHEPSRNDNALLSIEKAAKRLFPRCQAAREGKRYFL